MGKKSKKSGKEDKQTRINDALNILGGVLSIYGAVTDQKEDKTVSTVATTVKDVANKCIEQFSQILDVLNQELGSGNIDSLD